MSESNQVPETSIAPNKMWTTKMEDGQLQIVEVTPFIKSEDDITDAIETRVVKNDSEYTTLQMQMVETDKGMMQLDLLNMTLVRCGEGEADGNESYRLLTGSEASELMEEEMGMVTCVLQQSDGDSDDHADNLEESFIVMDGDKESFVYLPSTAKSKPGKPFQKPKLSPAEILQKTKAVQRAKAAMNLRPPLRGRPGRRKMESTLSTHEAVMSSSTLKLYLYSCKMCPFKCNAIKDLGTHRRKEHGTGAGRGRGAGGRYSSPMQCAGCTYRATTHSELLRHVKDIHGNQDDKTEIVVAHSSEDVTRLLEGGSSWGTTHVLVCGACGVETSTTAEFKAHPCSPIVLD